MRRILFCTVGGSYQPILTAVRQLSPDYVYFVCSRDQEGSISSEGMIIGKGKVIKAHPKDEKPTLLNIPTQLDMAQDAFEVVYVDPDNIDNVTITVDQRIKQEKAAADETFIYADYTGGTKSMSVGLVLAALENNANLHLIKGQRCDLQQVSNGTEWGFPASVEEVQFGRELKNKLSAWGEFAYAQAAKGLMSMQQPRNSELHQQLLRAQNLSRAFDAWDRFDHELAYKLLSAYRKEIGRVYPEYLLALDLLRSDKPASEPAKIYDLWLNAQRRAHQGRYDDAVARVYRIMEWTAQWVLRKDFDVQTSDLPEDFIPQDVKIYRNRQGKLQAPLFQTWQLVEHKCQGPLGEFIRQNRDDLLSPLDVRNSSILAHGFQPIDSQGWKKVHDWFESNMLQPFLQEAKGTGLKKPLQQLPREYI
ncbi:MAG: TIGR02710 family CRISPR-associated CARF protein [Desulfohalobiaceae bacterium]